MKKIEWENWLKEQQTVLDEVISRAGLEFFNQNEHHSNFWYDLRSCQQESYLLSQGKDLCYDRMATPLCYSLWYQGRRINTFLSHFLDKLLDIRFESQLDLFDLGAGTGAVQMCLGLIYSKHRTDNIPVPKLRIINVDSSPFMLAYNRDYLWPEFIKRYPYAKEISVEYHVNSWNNPEQINISSPWIAASYLFDISDDRQQILDDFFEIIRLFRPAAFLLLTSDQPKKRQMLQTLCDELQKESWVIEQGKVGQLLFQGK